MNTKQLKSVTDFIDQSYWKEAKTYRKTAPHEYTVKTPENKKQFENVVILIREHGYPDTFWNKTYIYLDVGTYKYWSMGSPPKDTIIINRTKHEKRIPQRTI